MEKGVTPLRHLGGPVFELGDGGGGRGEERRGEREAFDANGISAPFSKSGHHLDGE